MSSILGPIGREKLELFNLELGNVNQSAPNLVTMYMSIRSQMSLIMGQVIPHQSVLSALEIEKSMNNVSCHPDMTEILFKAA